MLFVVGVLVVVVVRSSGSSRSTSSTCSTMSGGCRSTIIVLEARVIVGVGVVMVMRDRPPCSADQPDQHTQTRIFRPALEDGKSIFRPGLAIQVAEHGLV